MDAINRWDALPEECKSMILSRLSTKDVARIARVSKEFLKAVNILRSSVRLLVLPPTLSVPALEGMVAAHPNLTSLSFKRCGVKLKTFVPIIKAAATGHNTVIENKRLDSSVIEKKRMRSLTAVDFRNCMHLIDTDVSILCSLHTRLEEVDLTNCPSMTDVALLTLSRYHHVEKPNDPLEKYSCYPRFLEKSSKSTSDTFTESEEMFLKDNDAAVFEEIQGLGLNSFNSRNWPRIGSSFDRPRKEIIVSSRKYEEGKILGTSPYSTMSKRGESSAAATANPVLKKSYAQMAKSAEKATSCSFDFEIEKSTLGSCRKTVELDPPLSVIEDIDPDLCNAEIIKPDDLDPTLTFIDWNLCGLSNMSAKSGSPTLNDAGLLSGSEYCSTSSSAFVADENLRSELAVTNRYRDMYKHYLIDEVENPPRALPDLIDKLCLSTVHNNDLSEVPFKPMSVQVDDSGSKYNSIETSISDDHIMRTQTSVFIPKFPPSSVEESDASKQKSFCLAGRTEIRDQRVQFDPLKSPGVKADAIPEAFCRTVNHVGLFSVPDTEDGFDLSDLEKIHDHTRKSNHLESLRPTASGDIENPAQLAIRLPDSINIGGILRRSMQSSQPPDCRSETVVSSEKSLAREAHLDVETDSSRSMPGLRSVCVASCPEITDRGVQALLKGTSRTCLSTLDVSRCIGVTNAGLRLPAKSGLQHLIAVQMPAINRLVYQLTSHSFLEHLNLAGCYKLEELVLVASSLKTLNLSNCKKLARLHLKCPSLTALNLSLCDGLERFIKFQCTALQSLNFMGCRMLLQSALNAAIESSGTLEDLRCGGCDRIERLDLVQPTLLALDISGCQSFKRLFCQSKVLRAVDACGCKMLAEVYLYSPYLRRMLFSNCALLQILVIPLDAIKEAMDTEATQGRRRGASWKQDELEISISGCNMPELVKRNLAKLTRQWHSCFKSAT